MIWVFIRTAPLDLTDPRSNVFPTVLRCDVEPPATAGGTDTARELNAKYLRPKFEPHPRPR